MSQPFRPVVIGPDLGAYSLARSFHEAYGLRSVVISNAPRGPVLDSAILDNVYAGAGAGPERILDVLEEVADRHPGEALLLLVNADHDVDMVIAHRERLEARYVVPMAAGEVLAKAGDKQTLQDVCLRLGIPFPATRAVALDEVRRSGPPPLAGEMAFPVVIKPAVPGDYLLRGFPGQRKVYQAGDEPEAHRVLRLLAEAQVPGEALVQELVPGDDTASRVVTCYRDRSGRITAMASGQVLLGAHRPILIGNGAAILTESQPELEEQAAAILAELGYTGLANFDVRIDPRDGVGRFLDLNPRIGRSHYYTNVAGVSPARAVVADHAGELGMPGESPARVQRGSRVGLYSYVPWWWLRRYLPVELRTTAAAARRRHGQIHPLDYPADRNLRRTRYRLLADLNQVRDFRRYYPAPTDTSF